MTTCRAIVLCATQRSGTTALQSALRRSGQLTNFGEVFHPGDNEVGRESNYFYYRERHPAPLPNVDSAARADLSRYLDYLGGLADPDRFLIDVKYNSWHHFTPAWRDPFAQPFILKVFKELGAPVIHVVRANVFRQVFSMEYARHTDRWHYQPHRTTESGAPDLRLALDPKTILRAMRASRRNTEWFRRHLDGHEPALELTYERMFRAGRLTTDCADKLRKLIHPDLRLDHELWFQQTPVDINQVVQNKRELVDFFQGTEFEYMVLSALSLEDGRDALGRTVGSEDPRD